ncbi:MAG: hypothetical protein COA58_08420 [Bacteroidetes bacterium]|nr:MAG: hypothetical protein COA58_08420 [Bacteroidota bacterium]
MVNNPEIVFGIIGKKLKQMRLESGYTSYETFAVDHDLSRRHYWAAEAGKQISLMYLMKILNIHKCQIDVFFNQLNAT